jgi:signal transduction histidine kinase
MGLPCLEMGFLRGLASPRRVAGLLVALAGLSLALGAWDRRRVRELSSAEVEADRQARLKAAEARWEALGQSLQAAADRAAALPEARDALRGERGALPGLFRSLEALGNESDAPAVAIHALPYAKVAWGRPTADIRGLEEWIGTKRGRHVLAGSVTTSLLAKAPITSASGQVLGIATVETALRVERNIENAYLRDFDRVRGEDQGLVVEYFDLPVPAAPTLPPHARALRDVDGKPLGVVTIVEDGREATLDRAAVWRRLSSTLLCAGLLVAGLGGFGLFGAAALVAAARAAVSFLGPPWPLPVAEAAPGRLVASPVDALLTSALLALLAACICRLALAHAPLTSTVLGSALSAVVSLPLLGIVFAVIGRVVAESPYDLAAVSLLPRSSSHLAMQASLLIFLGAALLLLVALLSRGGPLPATPRGRMQRTLLWAVVGGGAMLVWPRDLVGLPLVPVVLIFVLAALLAGSHERWRARLEATTPGGRAGLLLGGVAALSLLLHPTLVHFGEKAQRLRIEGQYAELIRRQSAWRGERLNEAQAQVDRLELLDETGSGRPLARLEDLAFSIWSKTGLNGAGLASAVELQDRSGAVISRFALELPALLASVPPRTLPKDDLWSVPTRERLQVASAERQVLHARRRFTRAGEVRGVVHLYVADDPWDLPFLPRRDPYGELFRSAAVQPGPEEALDLTVYAQPGGVLFTSAERPPTLSPALLERLRDSPGGLWTTLNVDGRAHHTYLVRPSTDVYAVSYPRLSAGRFLAGLAEAVAGLGGVTLVLILGLMILRTLAGRETLSLPSLFRAIRERFALRLFVFFVAGAVLPVAVLEIGFRGYVADRFRRESEEQALDRAAVAQRAVDDFSFYQRGEGPDRAAVTDTALVWVARLIRGDVDVFGRGRLLASSKRELFSSGLLPPTVPGPVFRSLTLEGAPSVLRTERIGGFSALVAYVPVRLDGVEPGILALPLAVKEREVRATLEDFDRSMRLASLAFLALAAGLALSLSRYLSGPIRDLTRATRRIARGDLAARVTTRSRDELKDLVDSFNQMAGDLDRQRRDLERSNRRAAWADMARQVAHEVKNPLTPIQLSAEHLQRVWRDGARDFGTTLAVCTDTILRQVRTLRGIATEFSAFARPPAAVPEAVDLGRLVEQALRPYRSSLPPGVSLELVAAPDVPTLRLDRRLVSRAIVNLVENALNAVGDSGKIVVAVRPAEDGEAVEIVVEDDGPGLTSETLARAFEPFFSTKSNGSGLGLALVRRVAEDHGGSATLESLGDGVTRARLRFPITEATALEDAPAALSSRG